MGNDAMSGPGGPNGLNSAAFGTSYGVELLYSASPALDAERLAAGVKNFCPQADASAADGKPPILFSHKDHLVPIDVTTDFSGDGVTAVPARTVVLPSDRVTDVSGLHLSLGQTRDWDAAVEALARSTTRVVVTDLLAKDLEPRDRLALFEAVLLGVIEAARPTAIHWKPAGKLVDPVALLKASGSDSVDALPAAAINVRMFKVKNRESDLLMDTLGLWALGLPDMQVLFHRMDPARVAAHLYAIALYTLRNGDTVQDGEAIEGPSRGQEWVVEHGQAIAHPARPVVNFRPGPGFSVHAA